MKKRPTKNEIEKTFNFVLDELIRHLEITEDIEKFRQVIQEDGWPRELPFPDGHRRMIGKDAHERLASLARTIVATDERLTGRVHPNTFFQILSEELGTAIWERKEVKEREFIETCVELTISKNLKPREYYIPCIAPYYQGMTQFRIGPVTFIAKPHFVKKYTDRIQTSKFDNFQEFYAVQNWVAHVRVDGFDKERAEERAFLIVRLAIASIKARLELPLAQWLGTEKQSMPGLTYYSLTSEPDGPDPRTINLGWGRQFILNGSNSQVESLVAVSSRTWFTLFGAFLEQITCLGQWSYLESKIVTALVWLDIGNSPISNAERVVAFSNCLEAIFVTKKGNKKTQLETRSRYLLEYSGWNQNLNEKVGDFYSKRSDIVHGDVMPVAAEHSSTAHTGKYLTDVCIEGFVHFSHWLLAKHNHLNTMDHELPYTGHGSYFRAMEQELPLFIQELKQR